LIARARSCKASALREMGEWDTALKVLLTVQHTYSSLGCRLELAATRVDIAWIHYRKGRLDDAQDMFRAAVEEYETLRVASGRGAAHSGLGVI